METTTTTDHKNIGKDRLKAQLQSRSMGVKLLIVGVLALLLMIPAFFVNGLVQDRTKRAAEVGREVSQQVGGAQTFLGPTLVIPYTIAAQYPGGVLKQGTYFVSPTEGDAVVKTSIEERRRSLFRVPVFRADAQFDAVFDLHGIAAAAPEGAVLDWPRAELMLGVSDARGALADGHVVVDGKSRTLAPARNAQVLDLAKDEKDGSPLKLQLMGVNAAAFASPEGRFTVDAAIAFSGARRVAVLAYGKTTHVAMSGDWASPGFDGSFLPVRRSVSKKGFTAEWAVPFIARGVGALGSVNVLSNLPETAMGVSFVEVADAYQSVSRALKYALLFMGLVFLTYFLFEVMTGRLVHPAQYVLVGVAQLIFYLLLLSLAERVGFGVGFLVAGVATVGLLAANAMWVFASRLQGWRALGIFSALYALIYLLLRLEDEALLLGAFASFALVGVAMYLTRQVDWYGSGDGSQQHVQNDLRVGEL